MAEPSEPALGRRGFFALTTTFAAYAALVATHRGEFWPFSIYPMFSLAGRPWRRALMVEVAPSAEVEWVPTTLDALPGPPVSTASIGISTNDMSKFVQLTDVWDDERIATLREQWSPVLAEGRSLLLFRADGHLERGGEVVTELTPLVRLDTDGHRVNPMI